MNIMTEQLPISIRVSDDLIAEISNIVAISNKLEAQLNFHTMTRVQVNLRACFWV